MLGFVSTGCATLPENYPRTSSTAFEDYLETSVGQFFEEAAAQRPDKCGFAIIRRGRQAFTARIALTELAAQVVAYMEEGVLPQNSYRVLLDEDGELGWITEIDGREVRYNNEPETSFRQRFMSGFIMMLPVEHQL